MSLTRTSLHRSLSDVARMADFVPMLTRDFPP
jgi:hypothetical protein